MTPVDIIILSWDRIDDTIAAVQSALDQEGVDVNVQIVDQGTRQEDLKRLLDFIAPYENVYRLLPNCPAPKFSFNKLSG